jgi:flagellar motor switch protein FliM
METQVQIILQVDNVRMKLNFLCLINFIFSTVDNIAGGKPQCKCRLMNQ